MKRMAEPYLARTFTDVKPHPALIALLLNGVPLQVSHVAFGPTEYTNGGLHLCTATRFVWGAQGAGIDGVCRDNIVFADSFGG